MKNGTRIEIEKFWATIFYKDSLKLVQGYKTRFYASPFLNFAVEIVSLGSWEVWILSGS